MSVVIQVYVKYLLILIDLIISSIFCGVLLIFLIKNQIKIRPIIDTIE